MNYLLGIDQGASKTIAVLGDMDGRICGVGYSGGACHTFDGMETAMDMVRNAYDQALRQAGAADSDIAFAAAGMTGADWDYEYPLLEKALTKTLTISNIRVYNDCMIAQRGGTDAPYSVVLCAGTAFNAGVTAPDGRVFIYGYYVNDEDMGGTSLGKAAITAVLNAYVGLSGKTRLTCDILDHYGLSTVEELLDRHIRNQLKPYKQLAPMLFENVKNGDPKAVEIVGNYGKSIARYAAAAIRKYGLTRLRTDVVLSGSIFKAEDRILQRTITESLRGTAPEARVVDALYEPAAGAYLLALDHHCGSKFPMRTEILFRSALDYELVRMPERWKKAGSL